MRIAVSDRNNDELGSALRNQHIVKLHTSL